MNRISPVVSRTSFKAVLAAAALGLLALAGCRREEPAAPPPAATEPAPAPTPAPAPVVEPAPTVTVTRVELGSAVGEDDKIAAPTTRFGKTDTIYAVVSTAAAMPEAPATGTLTARWTYQDGQLVDETSQQYDFSGMDSSVFQVSNPDGWPAGKYKLEILLDGELAQTREFSME